MTHAYDKVYLEKAQIALGRMLDFAKYDLNYVVSDFFNLFISSGVAKQFEDGEINILVGKSGVELAYLVLERSGLSVERKVPKYTVNRSEEYWAGWALARYQWETTLAFSHIVKCVPINEIIAMYLPYHEMDIRQFIDHMNELITKKQSDTNLKRIRQKSGLSQSALATESGVPLRTIQQYEQRQKNINKAGVENLLNIASVLKCDVSELVEKI